MSAVNRRKFLYLLSSATLIFTSRDSNADGTPVPWEAIRKIDMKGGLKVFWNVYGGDNKKNQRSAAEHGLKISDILNTFVDYPGGQKENIYNFLEKNRQNPWLKPAFFEKTVRKNIKDAERDGIILVHDIEFEFSKDVERAWRNPSIRKSANAKNLQDFSEKYYREWASWFYLPCKWSKQMNPSKPVGIYGPQVFDRDYWGFTRPSELEKGHQLDLKLWKHIDPYVDFYVASIYVFYDLPDSIYYMAANVEENYRRSRQFGKKPLYTYVWLRYHPSSQKLSEQEIAPYLAEAMAIVPFFTGAKGTVLWGWEPKATGQYYHNLPIFMNALGRVADLSAKMASAQLIIDRPAHELWLNKQPLVRKYKVSASEWVIMAVFPWQEESDRKIVATNCGSQSVKLEIRGKHTEIYHFKAGVLRRR
jgi:hypothetical protein